jgi:hypothetical protein
MRHLSFWAKKNPLKSRLIIAFCLFYLACAGVQAGLLLFSRNLMLGQVFLMFSVIVFMCGAMFYPVPHHYLNQKERYYALTRIFGFVLLFSGLLLSVFLGNKLPDAFSVASQSQVFTAQLVAQKSIERPQKFSIQQSKQAFNNWLGKRIQKKVQGMQVKLSDNGKRAGQIALGVLLFLAGMAALYLVVALSCTLACNGPEALALLVLILGMAGAVAIFSVLARKFFPKLTRGQSWIAGLGVILGILLFPVVDNAIGS